MPTLMETLELAKEAHGRFNEYDKSGKTLYYWHLVRVMLRLNTNDLELQQIALLHDVIEDTDITLSVLRANGYSEEVIEAVKWCSKNLYDGGFAAWMTDLGIHAPDNAILTKISDISDNQGFERMLSLKEASFAAKKNKPKDELSKKQKNAARFPLQDRVFKLSSKGTRLTGEMGVFSRYYEGWNAMFSNETNNRKHLIPKVFIDDFCFLHQFESLTPFLPQNELESYIRLNRINTWKILGKLEIIKDRIGQDYVAVTVSKNEISFYTNFLNQNIDPVFMENQKSRDSNTYHVTVINSMELNKIKKTLGDEHTESILKEHLSNEFNLFTYGIGQAKNNGNQAYFIVCDNVKLNQLRTLFRLEPKDLHVTLGFNQKDVFNVSKGKDTITFDNKTLWKSFVEQFYSNLELKNLQKNKIKF